MKKIILGTTISLILFSAYLGMRTKQEIAPERKARRAKLISIKENIKKKTSEVKKQKNDIKTINKELASVLNEKKELIGTTWKQQMNFEESATKEQRESLALLNHREVLLTTKRLDLLRQLKTKLENK